MADPQVATDRLVLRQWRDEDLFPFVAMNSDTQVMRYFPSTLPAEQSAEMIGRQQALLSNGEPGLFAAEVWATGEFIGFIGLAVPRFSAHFTPCVEIGWRLAKSAWGHGYATEGATAMLEYGFRTFDLPEIVSFTSAINERSIAVMERIGLQHNPADDFDHPAMAEGDRLRRHVLYRRKRPIRTRR
ncbi:MAG TPA: GNAT family N-acetyltransferase [Marmoricola sp.]|jgi:RimJ/RimL family protein N-acetyltransferase|nr:GNAT family N-acetyltransferase [Marmoricola sp.]